MMKLIFSTMWNDLKKNLPELLRLPFYLAAYYAFTLFMNVLSTWNSIVRDHLSVWEIIRSSQSSLTAELPLIAALLSVLLLLFLALAFYRIPLRLPRALYVCAADEQTKLRYLKRCLLVKIFCCTPLAVFFFIAFRFFENPVSMLIFTSLLIPFILNLSLRSDPGNRKLAELENPSLKTERSGVVISHVYWFGLLLLELLTFFSAYWLHAKWTPVWIAGWILVLILNLFLAVKCVPAVLRHLLDYETIYFPLKEEEDLP